jgi:hypothetical protein
VSFNGSGVFQLVAGNPVVTGTVISSTWANNTLSDIANNGLTNCITKDGQQTLTANIPFGGFRATGLGDAVNLQDATTAKQIQNGGLVTLASVAGTDTITASTAPAIGSYVSGQTFRFVSAGANTTNAVTLNIGALGAKALMKIGPSGLVQLSPGDLKTGQVVEVFYDGTQFQMAVPVAPNVPIPYTNDLLNGNFDVWQSQTSNGNATNGTTAYLADGWQIYRNSFSNNYTASQQTGPTGSSFCLRVQRTAGDTQVSGIIVSQSFETVDIKKWQGQQRCWSGQLLANGAFIGATFTAQVLFGTGTDGNPAAGFTGPFGALSASFTGTGAYQQISLPFVVPANATQMAVQVQIVPSSTAAGASDYFQVAQMMLNAGASPLPFASRPYGVELAECQRYWETGNEPYSFMNNLAGNTAAYGEVRLSVNKRVSPTITFSGWQYFSGGANTVFTPTISASLVDSFRFQATGLTNWQGWAGAGLWNANARL